MIPKLSFCSDQHGIEYNYAEYEGAVSLGSVNLRKKTHEADWEVFMGRADLRGKAIAALLGHFIAPPPPAPEPVPEPPPVHSEPIEHVQV